MTRKDVHHVGAAKYHFGLALSHASRDPRDQLVIDAVAMRLLAGIEGLANLSDPARAAIVGDKWAEIRGMRNRIAHGYAAVDSDYMLDTVRRDLPELITRLETFTEQRNR